MITLIDILSVTSKLFSQFLCVDAFVFVLCVMGQKMLMVISGFACIYKCMFLVIICNFSSLVVLFFSVRNGGKHVLHCFP